MENINNHRIKGRYRIPVKRTVTNHHGGSQQQQSSNPAAAVWCANCITLLIAAGQQQVSSRSYSTAGISRNECRKKRSLSKE